MERVSVLIQRNANTRIPTQVFDYEIPVLQAIHGDEAVIVGDSVPSDEPFEPEQAFDCMQLKYSAHSGDLLSVYKNPAALARAVDPKKKN